MRTRRGKLAPSGLAKMVEDFAKSGKYAVFLSDSAVANPWLECGGDRLYVRGYKRAQLQLANWQFKVRGRGHATALLTYLEELLVAGGLPQSELYVESVFNERFAEFFRRRPGWTEVPNALSFVYGIPSPGAVAGSPQLDH
jgi:hypothetical protein